MKKIFLGFGLLSTVSIAHAAVLTVTDFPFEREVQLPSFADTQEVRVDLDREVLQAVNERFGNFALFDRQNTPVQYDVFFEDFHRIKDLMVVNTSSAKTGIETSTIADDDVLTTFIFDERVDGRNESWVLLDLGKPLPLTRLEVFIPEGANVRSIAVDGGKTQEELKTIISKRTMQQRFELTTDPIRFLKLSFWGVQVKIDDIRIAAAATGSVYFSALPEKKFRILYGGNVDRILYKSRISSEKDDVLVARLGRQQFNNRFPSDGDGDRVETGEDNCPFAANPSQNDSDGDRIGDECDNALSLINSRQEDTDRDGVGDAIDNCKLVANLDQADRDNDRWGDACDNAHATEPGVVSNWIKIAGGVAIVILLVMGLLLARRTRKLKR